MPKNTKVARCVDKVKKELRKDEKDPSSAYPICQKSTQQSYKTGKKLK
jgi:hypothetical protein